MAVCQRQEDHGPDRPCDAGAGLGDCHRLDDVPAWLRTANAKTMTAKAYRLLKAIMETAVDDGLITRNPCRIKGAGKEKAAEWRIATVAQVDALANAVGMRWRLMVYLGAYGPMRPEELAGSAAGMSTSTTCASVFASPRWSG